MARQRPNAVADIPPAIETLFYVVEAYCPDPALRDPDKSRTKPMMPNSGKPPRTALAALAKPSRIMTFLSRMKP